MHVDEHGPCGADDEPREDKTPVFAFGVAEREQDRRSDGEDVAEEDKGLRRYVAAERAGEAYDRCRDANRNPVAQYVLVDTHRPRENVVLTCAART